MLKTNLPKTVAGIAFQAAVAGGKHVILFVSYSRASQELSIQGMIDKSRGIHLHRWSNERSLLVSLACILLFITCLVFLIILELSGYDFPTENFAETMKLMENRYGAKDFVTSKDTSLLYPGTFYLTQVDSLYRRYYAKKGADDTTVVHGNRSFVNGH